jgi:hypothetical protein
MTDDLEAMYLGGHPGVPAAQPVAGSLRFGDVALQFMVMGEYYDELFSVPWADVAAWDVEGANTARRRSTGGRAAGGALLAGVPGAIIGAASTKEEFEAVLAVQVADATIAFLIRDRSPTAVAALMRRVPEMSDRKGAAPAPLLTVQWEYLVATLEELEVCGKAGWEAVGVWTDPTGSPQILMKRQGSEAP